MLKRNYERTDKENSLWGDVQREIDPREVFCFYLPTVMGKISSKG